jgi:hypothetical protein
MKKINNFSAAILAMACGCFAASCSDDNATSGIPVTGITLTEVEAGGELTVKALETLKVTASTSPDNASYKRVLFESSDPQIMTVNQSGVITGVKKGSVTLRVFAADGGGASVNYTVNVDYDASVTNVKTPGTLSQLLGNRTNITSLKLAGTFNDADFETLTSITGLQTLDLSLTSVTAIPDDAFYASASTRSSRAFTRATEPLALASVNLPATVASIGKNAFRGCTALTAVTLNAVTPPKTDATAFSDISRKEVLLTVPDDSYDAYREAEVYGKMTINGIKPEGIKLEIPAAPGLEQWQRVTLTPALSTSDVWTLVAVSTQSHNDVNKIQFGSPGWGVHLLNITYTGTIGSGFVNGNGKPFEFYLGGPSQNGTKVGAIGRGNWNSTTHTMTPYAITLNAPVTITLHSAGDGGIACTVQNAGLNDGAPVDFKTITGVETITEVFAAQPALTYVTINMEE